MKHIYECDYCKKQFNDDAACRIHEMLHLNSNDEMFKYWVRNIAKDDICKYCDHAYYVYGCELACSVTDCCMANNHQHFTLDQRLFEKKE